MRADWKLESAKLEVTLMPRDLGVGVCVSRCEMSAESYVDSGGEVSWNGSMCTVSLLDAEPAGALAWEADPFDSLNSLFPLTWRNIWPLRNWKLSPVHFAAMVPPGQTSCVSPSQKVCAGSGTTLGRHLCPSCAPHKIQTTSLLDLSL